VTDRKIVTKATATPPVHPQAAGMDLLRRLATTSSPNACAHVPATTAAPQADSCQECGSTYNLRLCATCGHVGCCESQAGDARAHALDSGHPIIYQMPADSGFIWCYTDRKYVG